MQVLILEDYFPLQQELVRLVENSGHQASAAVNATEATDLLKRTNIDAVIADIFVKEGDKFVPDGGILLISRIRTNFDQKLLISKDAPILAITAATDQVDGMAAIDSVTGLGADACLRKPLDMSDVKRWLQTSQHGG